MAWLLHNCSQPIKITVHSIDFWEKKKTTGFVLLLYTCFLPWLKQSLFYRAMLYHCTGTLYWYTLSEKHFNSFHFGGEGGRGWQLCGGCHCKLHLLKVSACISAVVVDHNSSVCWPMYFCQQKLFCKPGPILNISKDGKWKKENWEPVIMVCVLPFQSFVSKCRMTPIHSFIYFIFFKYFYCWRNICVYPIKEEENTIVRNEIIHCGGGCVDEICYSNLEIVGKILFHNPYLIYYKV